MNAYRALRGEMDPLWEVNQKRIEQEQMLGELLKKNKITLTEYEQAKQYLANQPNALVRDDSLFRALQNQHLANRYTGKDGMAVANTAQGNLNKALVENAPTLPSLSPETGGAFSELNQLNRQYAQYKEWYDRRLDLLRDFENERYGVSSEAAAARSQLEQQHTRQVEQYEQASQIARMQGFAQLYDTFAGSQSGAYKAMLIAQKLYTPQSILLSSKEALANAWASGRFPANLSAVATVLVETGALQAAAAAVSTSFAGAYDKGGHIPGGKWGIVSEYGDELVNGTLIKGPATVTGREDTAALLSQAASVVAMLPAAQVLTQLTSSSRDSSRATLREVERRVMLPAAQALPAAQTLSVAQMLPAAQMLRAAKLVPYLGAFDNGGKIAAGGAGVVAEKGNELVNGVLVSGPATVTGRTQTADLLNKVVENSRSDSAINVTYAPVISVSMDGNAQQNGNSQALIQQMGKLIDDRTKASFTQFLIEQKRPGGLLSK